MDRGEVEESGRKRELGKRDSAGNGREGKAIWEHCWWKAQWNLFKRAASWVPDQRNGFDSESHGGKGQWAWFKGEKVGGAWKWTWSKGEDFGVNCGT